MASKSKRRRKVLGASCILAALIIAGSSFAWFTSKDEVTNRLSANSEYGVAIAENFQPPETWVPGQEINKDVGVVNTGNVDAFARVWLTGNMRLLNQTASGTAVGSIGTPTAVTDDSLLSMGLTKTNGNGLYYKTLSKSQTINPNAAASSDPYGFGTQMSGAFSEVQAMQGSRLAYAPTDAKYAYVLKEETTLPIYVKKGTSSTIDSATAAYEEVAVPAGTVVYVNADTPVAATITDGTFAPAAKISFTSASGAEFTTSNTANKGTVYIETPTSAITNVEYESFTPFTDGLYLFLRNEADSEVVSTDLEFSGYYATGLTANNASTGTFYALNTNTDGTNRSDYTVKSVANTETATVASPVKTTIVDGIINAVTPDTSVLQVFTADYSDVIDTDLKWYYVAPASSKPGKIYAVYDAATADNKFTPDTGTSKDIVIEITLDNLGTTGETWTAKNGSTAPAAYDLDGTSLAVGADKLTFYYNDDIEAGDTTEILVDKVTLYSGVTNKAYLGFDFDLNVNLESVQVTFDENGNEQTTAVEHWDATTGNSHITGANATRQSSGEISNIVWGDYAAP